MLRVVPPTTWLLRGARLPAFDEGSETEDCSSSPLIEAGPAGVGPAVPKVDEVLHVHAKAICGRVYLLKLDFKMNRPCRSYGRLGRLPRFPEDLMRHNFDRVVLP